MTAQDLLTGPAAGDILAAAVEAAGGRLLSWRANQVDQRGASTTVAYATQVRWAAAEVSETFGATTGGSIPAGATLLGDGSSQVGVWRASNDPLLPGLRAAMDPAAMSRVLERCGLRAGPVRLRLRAYRPMRRAVVEAVGPAGRLFVKVVPQALVRDLHERHRLLTDAGVPVPRSLGWSDDGLLVLEALPGRTLRSSLRPSSVTDAGAGTDPGALVDLLDRLPLSLLEAPGRSSWLERTEHYAGAVGSVVPELSSWATDLAAVVVAESNVGPIVPVHGDFYEAQLLVDAQGNITGLLDVDTAGPGDRLDDLACLVGHLSVLAQVLPQDAPAIDGLGARCLTIFDTDVDPRQLRLRIASVVLSLATGPHRVQEAGWRQATRDRLALAERWIESAARVHPKERKHHVSTA